MSSSEKPKKLTSPVDFKIIAIIVGVAIVLQIYLFYGYEDSENKIELGDLTYSIGAAGASISAFLISRHYKGSEIFGKAYFALGIGFLLLFVGDSMFNYYEHTGQDPYPSIADIFFYLYPVFAVYHLIKNIKYFKRDIKKPTLLGLVGISALIVGSYAFIAFEELEEFGFDFWYGLFFVLGAGIIFSLAILGAAVFRHSVLGSAWLLLAIGIFIYTIADVWYYYLELIEQYEGSNPVNSLWFLSFMLIIYALFKHQKVI